MAYCNNDISIHLVTDGRYIEEWDNNISFYFNPCEGSEMTDFICNTFSWTIVSERFKNVMETNNITGFQYLTTTVINKDNNKSEKYYVLNVIKVLDAINLDKSEYIDIPGVKTFITRVINKDKINGEDVFKLKEDHISIIISEKVKSIIEDNKFTGFSFRKVKAI
ncbi:Imm43 family immunity protein [Clostridium botulinum]